MEFGVGRRTSNSVTPHLIRVRRIRAGARHLNAELVGTGPVQSIGNGRQWAAAPLNEATPLCGGDTWPLRNSAAVADTSASPVQSEKERQLLRG